MAMPNRAAALVPPQHRAPDCRRHGLSRFVRELGLTHVGVLGLTHVGVLGLTHVGGPLSTRVSVPNDFPRRTRQANCTATSTTERTQIVPGGSRPTRSAAACKGSRSRCC